MPREKGHDRKQGSLSGAINAFQPIDDLLADLEGKAAASAGATSTGHKRQTRGESSSAGDRKATSKAFTAEPEPKDRISSDRRLVTGHHHGRRRTENLWVRPQPLLRLPVDLPTEDYAAIIQTPNFLHYLDYPARIHHLKYPSRASSSSSSSWEDTHLHQPVSQPRINIRWTRLIEDDDRRAMARFFRFSAPNGHPFLGFRPYRDILFLDTSYLAAHAAARAAAHKRLGPPPALVPFIIPTDRAKITLLAVAAGAFASLSSGAELASLCGVLTREFPGLQRLLVTSIAVVDRPVNARWDLETEFAYWGRFDADGKLHGQDTSAVAKPGGASYPSKSAKGKGLPLPQNVNEVFMQVRRDVAMRREKGDKVRHETEMPAAGKVRGKSERRYIGRRVGDVRGYEPGASLPGTGGMARTDTGISKAGEKSVKDFEIEPYVLLYFRDAFHRAAENGWEHGDLLSLENMTVEMH